MRLRWLAALALVIGCKGATPDNSSSSASGTAQSAAASNSSTPSAAVSVASSAIPDPPKPAADEPPRAIDMHVDTPWQVKYKGRNIALTDGMASMEALKTGKYGGIVYPIYIPDYLHDDHPTIQDATEIFATIDAIIKAHPDVLHAYTDGPTPPGKVTAYVSIEGGGCFAQDITKIDEFIARGVIFVGPVHWHDTPLATSATGADKKKRGFSELGKKFAARVYEAGGLVDVSHMSDKSFADLVPIAEKYGAPIVATHSNARKLLNHPRNLTDDQLKIIAKTGGIAGLNFYEKFVAKKKADVDDLVKHALHMIEVAGIDHVGIGSDLEGGDPAKGLENAGKIQALAAGLRKAGLSAEDVHKIFSENVKRVLKWVEGHRKKKE